MQPARGEPLLAELEKRACEGPSLWKRRAEVDVASEGERRVRPHRGAHAFAGELYESVLERSLAVRQRVGPSKLPQAVLGDVPDEIPDVQSRLTLAVEVEVDEIEVRAVDDHLIGVEVAVDAGGRGARRRRGEPLAAGEKRAEAPGVSRLRGCHARQTLAQDPQLVFHRVALGRRDANAMDLVRGLR